MQILRLQNGDVIRMKKSHPCGADLFTVERTGTDVRIVCTGCGRDLLLPREKVEKMIKCIEKAVN